MNTYRHAQLDTYYCFFWRQIWIAYITISNHVAIPPDRGILKLLTLAIMFPPRICIIDFKRSLSHHTLTFKNERKKRRAIRPRLSISPSHAHPFLRFQQQFVSDRIITITKKYSTIHVLKMSMWVRWFDAPPLPKKQLLLRLVWFNNRLHCMLKIPAFTSKAMHDRYMPDSLSLLLWPNWIDIYIYLYLYLDKTASMSNNGIVDNKNSKLYHYLVYWFLRARFILANLVGRKNAPTHTTFSAPSSKFISINLPYAKFV